MKEVVAKGLGKEVVNIHYIGIGENGFEKYLMVEIDEKDQLAECQINHAEFVRLVFEEDVAARAGRWHLRLCRVRGFDRFERFIADDASHHFGVAVATASELPARLFRQERRAQHTNRLAAKRQLPARREHIRLARKLGLSRFDGVAETNGPRRALPRLDLVWQVEQPSRPPGCRHR